MNVAIKPFVYVSLKDWCRPVNSVAELEARPNSYLTTPYRARFEPFGRPDFHDPSDEANIELYGAKEFIRIWPYNLPVYNYSLWNDDTYMASVENAVLLRDNFIGNRCHVLVREGIAAAESYHSMQMVDPVSRMSREQFDLRVGDSATTVNLYRDFPAQAGSQPEGILMTHVMMDNYAHFLNEVVPRFWWLELIPSLRKYPVLMPRYPAGSYQEQVLTPLLEGLQVCELNAPAIRFQKLFVPTFLSNGSYSREMAAFTDRVVRRALGITKEKSRCRRIYISRCDATQRRVLNEDAVLKALAPFGFECHVTGKMSVREQVELFSEADIILTPHGAGVANIVFAPEGSLLIELLSEPYLHPMYWMIAKLKRMRYARLVAPSASDRLDMMVDIPRLLACIEWSLQTRS